MGRRPKKTMILSLWLFGKPFSSACNPGMNQIDPASPSSVGKPEQKKYPVEDLSG